LIKLLSAVDAVFDQFNAGSAGLLVLECMSMGIPTFIYFSPEYEEFFKEPPPVINVFTEDEICNKITELCTNAGMRVNIGLSARNWIIKYFHWELVTKQFIKFYEDILNGRS
jgi:glycosyltransferase involved in cell wall biosynthesis